MNRRKVLLIAAALVALLGVALVFLYVRAADDRAEARFDTINVLTAVAPIEAGETIDDAATSGKLSLQPVAQDDLLPNYQTSTEQLTGQVATTTIYPGEQIITDKFGKSTETLAAKSALEVPPGDVAISVSLSDPGRVAGFLNPGSEVTILYVGPAGTFSRMLLPRVTVLGVGSTTTTTQTTTTAEGEQTTAEIPKTLLTIAVSKVEAEKVTFADAGGEVVLALRTPDSTVKPGGGITSANVFK